MTGQLRQGAVIVGVSPAHPARAAVRLGALLARSHGAPLVLTAITSAAWPPLPSNRGADSDFREFATRQAEAALAEALTWMPADLEAQTLVKGASSARRGLIEVCEEHAALRLVVGARAEGSRHEIELGSVASGLMQSAPLPIAIAPHDFDVADDARVPRLTASYSGSETSGELVLGAAATAAKFGCGIRVASFHTRPRGFAEAGVGLDVEDEVIEQWGEVIQQHVAQLLSDIEEFAAPPEVSDAVVGVGHQWHDALRAAHWLPGELLLVGSTSLGPIARVSLGSHAVKIVRHSPVPVVVVPRRATGSYIAQAKHA